MNAEQTTTGIMVRSVEAVDELRDLCTRYVAAQNEMVAWESAPRNVAIEAWINENAVVNLTWDEVQMVLKQRRQDVVTLLENKGVRVSEPKP
jgi:hypothetical protein